MRNIKELSDFIAVMELKSFTKAANHLRISTSALSHSIRNLEERLNVKLFNRTTRSVSPTDEGEMLYRTISPRLTDIENALNNLQESQGKVAGVVRITAIEHALDYLWDKLSAVLKRYPDLKIETNSESRFTNIVADRFDLGVRFGHHLEQDMIAVRISPDIRMVVVATPKYLAEHGTPQTPEEILSHQTVGIVLPSTGRIMPWEFQRDGKKFDILPNYKIAVNHIQGLINACLDDFGLMWLMQESVQKHLDSGELVTVLDDFATVLDGYHLYYSSRNQSAAVKVVIEALKREE